MMKNKKITYLLIILVIMIWSVIFYRIYSNFRGKVQTMESFQKKVPGMEPEIKDSVFTLSLNYPDPFLKGAASSSYWSETDAPANNVNYYPVAWPPIEYRGLLTSRDNNISTGLLKIHNSDFLAKEGSEYATVKVRQMTSDSICLEFQKEIQWVQLLKANHQ